MGKVILVGMYFTSQECYYDNFFGWLTSLEHIYVCELYNCCVCAVHDMVISQANGWRADLDLPTKAGCFDVMVTSSLSSFLGVLLV